MQYPTATDSPISFGSIAAPRDMEREAANLEVLWVGVLKVPVGSLEAGAEMRAHFAVFLEFRDGLIYRQRNYDGFEPF